MPVEDGRFVAYEWIGEDNLLNEPGARTRGAMVISLDALMLARRDDTASVLVVFEWKYGALLPRLGRDIPAADRPREDLPPTARPSGLPDQGRPTRRPLLRALLPAHAPDPPRLADRPAPQTPGAGLAARARRARAEPRSPPTKPWPERAAPDLPGETMEEAWRPVLKQPERVAPFVAPQPILAEFRPILQKPTAAEKPVFAAGSRCRGRDSNPHAPNGDT
jgi:hypothetical protein